MFHHMLNVSFCHKRTQLKQHKHDERGRSPLLLSFSFGLKFGTNRNGTCSHVAEREEYANTSQRGRVTVSS